MKIVFPSPKRGGMGVTKCQTDRQCADQTTTWLVTDAGRALHILYQRHLSPQLSSQPQQGSAGWKQPAILRAAWWCLPLLGFDSSIPNAGLWATSRWEAQTLPRTPMLWCEALVAYWDHHCIYSNHFHSKCEALKLWHREQLFSDMQSCNREENKALIFNFRTNNS